ncbi:hypothetical protein LCGC14_1786730 [marine sediment metagenome]|uniref:Response regulatory domain-containing protein n=1 Tax=marine sediment metagenome TaxID=412755 RepID=A0A0F9J8P5_9ZZZZ
MTENVSILISDDNLSLTKTMKLILEHENFKVETTNDGFEAIEKVKNENFDIIFLDIKMPNINGVDVLKKIKKIKPNSIVIMMTAYSVDELINEAFKWGAIKILHKPIDIKNLLKSISKAIHQKTGNLVLIVDDDPGFCLTIEKIFSRKGYNVSVVHNGEDAIRIVKEKPYEIILLDIKLPTINGFETLLEIKKINSEINNILITGYKEKMSEFAEKAIIENAITCLYKPLNLELLFDLIDKILY